MNKRAVECLVKCGAFDSTGASRRGLLEALPAAIAFGQKAQEDSRLGQSSIFDLGGGAEESGRVAATTTRRSGPRSSTSASCFASRRRRSAPSSPRIRSPRSRRRSAPRVDCPLSSLADKPDGSWVTVGGIVTEFKRHKSKNGSLMSFATLDDVEGQVEMLVMGKAYEASQEFLAADAIVIVRGRLDHKGRGDTKLVAQEVELFEPTEDEVSKARAAKERDSGPLRLHIDASGVRRLGDRGAEDHPQPLPGGLRGPPGDEDPRGYARAAVRARATASAARLPSTPNSTPCSAEPPGRLRIGTPSLTGLMGSGSHRRRAGNGPESFQAESWTTRQLAEFLSVVSSFTDERDAAPGLRRARRPRRSGPRWPSSSARGRSPASVGFPPGSEPVADLRRGCRRSPIRARARGPRGLHRDLLAGRRGRARFWSRGPGAVTSARRSWICFAGWAVSSPSRCGASALIGELRERQTLLERLTLLQRSIASRADIEEVFDAIVTGASELLGDETGGPQPDRPGRPDRAGGRGVGGLSG